MRAFQSFFSVMLLLVFGLMLGGEVFGKSFHISGCENAREISGLCSHIPQKLKTGHSHATHEKCSDPCHAGQSHFGHCSFVALGSQVQCLREISSSAHNGFLRAWIDGPAQEGPRRPPRQI